MGTEVSSENWGWAASPRISFSQDISRSDGSPGGTTNVRPSLPLDPDAAEFDFSISTILLSAPDPSPADELFSDGKILPLPIKNRPGSGSGSRDHDTASVLRVPRPPNPNHRPVVSHDDKKGSLREVMDAFEDDSGNKRVAVGSCHRPFWRFGRSSSIGSCKSRGSLICPFPLARSKSTGSFPNQNQNPNPNPNPTLQKHRRKTNQHNIDDNQQCSSEAAKPCYYNQPRSSSSSNGNVMRINPVLNVPAPNFPRGSSRTTGSNNTSVLAYLLCNCKDKNMERSAPSSSP